jgi:hypothetical protein
MALRPPIREINRAQREVQVARAFLRGRTRLKNGVHSAIWAQMMKGLVLKVILVRAWRRANGFER